MTNSMERKINFKSPEGIISLIPIIISSGIAILLIIFYVIPKYIKSTKSNLELNALIKKKNELDDIKSQYKIINQKFDKLNNEKSRIIELISGTSNLDTLLSNLGDIGKKNNIEFLSIIPKKVIIPSSNSLNENINKNNEKSKIIFDPLLVEGIKKYLIDFSFNTDFVSLLSFLRELEFLENVILLNDINIKLVDQKVNDNKVENNQNILDVKLNITFYGKY